MSRHNYLICYEKTHIQGAILPKKGNCIISSTNWENLDHSIDEPNDIDEIIKTVKEEIGINNNDDENINIVIISMNRF
jgi:hypothetical protein